MSKLTQFQDGNLALAITVIEKDKVPVHKEFLIYNKHAVDSSDKDIPTHINITAACLEYIRHKSEKPDAEVNVFALGFVNKLCKADLDKIKGGNGKEA